MKNLNIKTTLLALALLVSFSSFVKANYLTEGTNLQFSVNSYINKIKTGSYKELTNILADDVKFNMTRNGKVVTHGKREELAFMKQNKDVVQQCKVESATLVSTANYSLVKISSVYANFTRVDFVTLVKAKNNWQITDVTTDYK
ncbi:nuclear transport factor 2 family protein [Pedobacter sp. SD-b]|uniref:Nuclear transport factor 2 family protein n=1 Tax=Pedobacter segetis TaxID=2793069 RepID=A0ABS1BLJ5_9SPHI|nr:nuclear transport factor 2 family protein [Pedobacter segetis]MBK0383764.1 nuclear transport factor 2 family protein [Pedobacter segetis]